MGKLREKLTYGCGYCNILGFTRKSELIAHIHKSHPGKEIKEATNQHIKLKKG